MDRLLAFAAAVVLLAAVGACATENAGITPPRDELYFPTGLALAHWIDPEDGEPRRDRQVMIVTNSNADLRYNGGTLTVLDLSRLPEDLARLGDDSEAGCVGDRFSPSSWECDERKLIIESATIRVGAFPNEVRVSERVRAAGSQRIFSPVRGDNELTWADLASLSLEDGEAWSVDLRCDNAASTGCGEVGIDRDCPQWDCDADHRVTLSDPRDIELPIDPFGLAVNALQAVHLDQDGRRRTCLDGLPEPPSCTCGDAQGCDPQSPQPGCCFSAPGEAGFSALAVELVYVAHLEEGQVSLLRSRGTSVEVLDVQGGLFDSGGTPVGGAFGVALQRPGDAETTAYVSSSRDGDLAAIVVQGSPDAEPQIVPAGSTPIGAIQPPLNEPFDLRGLTFGPGGERLFSVSRFPGALVALDLVERDGVQQREPAWAVEVCSEPATVVLGPHDLTPQAQFAYVVCFADAAIFVVDTFLAELVGRIETGRGPNGLVIDAGSLERCSDSAPCLDGTAERCSAGRCVKRFPRAFVANFLENTVGMIDLRPESPTYRRMVARLGRRTSLVDQ